MTVTNNLLEYLTIYIVFTPRALLFFFNKVLQIFTAKKKMVAVETIKMNQLVAVLP